MIGGKKRMEQGHSKKETGVISNFDQCNAKRQPGNMAGRNNAILGPSPPIWPIGENVPRVGCIAAALKNQQGPFFSLQCLQNSLLHPQRTCLTTFTLMNSVWLQGERLEVQRWTLTVTYRAALNQNKHFMA